MFRSIGPWEIIIVLALALVIFGAAKLPTMAHSLGKSLTSFKRGLKDTADEVKDALKEDAVTDSDSTATSDLHKKPAATSDDPPDSV